MISPEETKRIWVESVTAYEIEERLYRPIDCSCDVRSFTRSGNKYDILRHRSPSNHTSGCPVRKRYLQTHPCGATMLVKKDAMEIYFKCTNKTHSYAQTHSWTSKDGSYESFTWHASQDQVKVVTVE